MTTADAYARGRWSAVRGASSALLQTSATLPLFALALAMLAPSALARHGADAKNMELIGFSDLQARSAYQPVIQNQNGRWIAYVGHHGGTAEVPKPVNPLTGQPEFNGTSIIDVTDPGQPKYLHHIPGEEGLDEGGIAYLVSGAPGWHARRMTQIFPEFANDRDPKRDFVLIVNESLVNECAEARQMAWFADVTVESRPQIVSNFTVPEASGNFAHAAGASARIHPTKA